MIFKKNQEKSLTSKYFEENKINKLFEELIKDFKLYTKRCAAFNCNYNNEFNLILKKYLKQNKTKIIKIDDKPKQINLLDDKPKQLMYQIQVQLF